ncbi:Ral GTPase-activating protein subunit alpha-1 [Sarcoptes scabiei]|uniref:Ral GTPase-activating protein subunit alpha-1 n=1 Tax=Sarcoptes scabiei TaxID=52283 RepID=A0A834R316_SARSC|nr:Ral GTPase-activating protein subunit alpha-1 [Sarcoptes scabiei]
MQSIKFKSTKQQFDTKKSLIKLFDVKRDCFSRLRALKSICDAKDINDVKSTFILHRSVIYMVFYETFIVLDAAKFNSHRKNPTDDDRLMFFILEKILTLLPDYLEQKWQLNSLIFVFRKCLHPSNLLAIRLESIRLFLIYYQILGEKTIRANQQLEILYASLIPGLVTEMGYSHHFPSEYPIIDQNQRKYFGIRPYPIEPFIMTSLEHPHGSLNAVNSNSSLGGPITSVEKNQSYYEFKNYNKILFIQSLLDATISQSTKILWSEVREYRQLSGVEFLFSSFARIYLPYIFPKLAVKNYVESEWNDYTVRLLISIYNPPSDLPKLKKFRDYFPNVNSEQHSLIQSIIVQWFIKYLFGKSPILQNSPLSHNDSNNLSKLASISQPNLLHQLSNANHGGGILSGTTQSYFQFTNNSSKMNSSQNSLSFEYECEMFRMMINSRRFYVDLIMNLFNQAFQWPFNEDLIGTMRDVVKVFRQWIYKETNTPLPLFLAEPIHLHHHLSSSSNSTASVIQNNSNNSFVSNDDNVCAGYMNMLNIFIISSCNVFLLEIPSEMAGSLEKQVDLCKRVFNIYRFMVMKIEMEPIVWQNLVQVLIRVTECIISPQLPLRREDTLGGRLAPALFQTLIVTWIKANLNICVSNQLWDQFHHLLRSLTQWEELINEWSNTMFILNRVMSRYVFNINLNELPMDKTISDRKKELKSKPKVHQTSNVAKSSPSSHQQHSPLQQQQSNSNYIEHVHSQHLSLFKSNHSFSQSHHHHQDRTSRASFNSDSTRSELKIQRLISNDSGSDHNHDLMMKFKKNGYIPINLLKLYSVTRHREFHKNYLIHPFLHRSISDSCLALTVQKSMCSLNSTNKFIFKRRSCFSSKHFHNKKLSTFIERSSYFRNPMPMIDDETDEDDSCMLSETDEMNHCTDDLSLSDYSIIDYFQRQSLFNSNSMTDLSILATHNMVIYNQNHQNGSDLMAETLSLGASVPDANSLKETPMTFDSTSATSTCSGSILDQQISINSCETNCSLQNPCKTHYNKNSVDADLISHKPVLLGGQSRGWNAEAAAILWRRMLGILGNINDIEDPNLHRMTFECLAKITEDFTKIRDNISFLNTCPNKSPHQIVPSLHYFTSWLFEATTLPERYKSGRLLVYKLLCTIAMYKSEQDLGKDFLILFYLALKRAILSYDMDFINTIVKYCGSKFFSASLWGSSCLLFHFVSAANVIIGSVEVRTYPRTESLQLLGSLIGFFDVFNNVLCLKNAETLNLEPYTDLKDHVIEILIGASKREQTGLGRVIAFCSLGIFLYREFIKRSKFNRIKEIINILIAGTRISVKRPKMTASPTRSSPDISRSTNRLMTDNSKFNNRVMCRVACDMIRLLADHSQYLVDTHPDFVKRIIEGLCYTLELHIEIFFHRALLKDFKNLLLSIMFCLSHWCMSIPKDYLLKTPVSSDYPGKFHKVFNPLDDSNPDQSEANHLDNNEPNLMNLIIYLYLQIVNLNPIDLALNQSKTSFAEELKGTQCVGDMDTIDYTLLNQSGITSENLDQPAHLHLKNKIP